MQKLVAGRQYNGDGNLPNWEAAVGVRCQNNESAAAALPLVYTPKNNFKNCKSLNFRGHLTIK